MKTILCKNVRIDPDGNRVVCGGFLAALTDIQIDILRVSQERAILRCHSCPPEARWVSVGFGPEGISIEPADQPERYNEPKYSKIQYCEQEA